MGRRWRGRGGREGQGKGQGQTGEREEEQVRALVRPWVVFYSSSDRIVFNGIRIRLGYLLKVFFVFFSRRETGKFCQQHYINKASFFFFCYFVLGSFWDLFGIFLGDFHVGFFLLRFLSVAPSSRAHDK